MITFRKTLNATLAVLLISGMGLAGCEKAANGGPTPTETDDFDTANRSTVPDLPALNRPYFSPDLVDRIGGVDLFAIAEGKLALTRTQNADVKAFATSAIEAHTKLLTALGGAIDASGQTISYPEVMPNDLAARVAILKKADKAKFDQIYLADQIELQTIVVSALQNFAKHGDIAQFRTFAQNAQPGARSILTAAQTLQSTLK